MIAVSTETVATARAFRISPKDTNYFAVLFDPEKDGIRNVFVIEIFTPGGATPPNTHAEADEFFYVLAGEGVARCGGAEVALKPGSAMLLHPGHEHIVENTGTKKLYCLTVMTPNEGFAELIRGGEPVALDAEDLAVLGGSAMDESLPLGASPRNQWRVSAHAVDLRRAPLPEKPRSIQAEPQRVTLDLARTAILVIDMQNDFCHPKGWLGHIGVDVTPARAPIVPLAALLPGLRAEGVPVLWVNWGNRPDRLNLSPSLLHVYKPTGSGTGLGDPLPGSGAHVLEEGSWSAAVVDELAPAPGDIHVSKFRMSGFWDTELDSILRNLGVTTLLFAGVNVDQCVLCTLQDANFLGYDCILLEDCSATTSPGYCFDATVYNVRQCFGFVAQSTSLLATAPS